jgi:DNA-binding NtrC family response regulator
VPPLRERAEDILPLAEFYLARHNANLRFSAEAVEKLTAYAWPGNVRELRNVVIRSAVFAAGAEITVADLPDEFRVQSFSNNLHTMAALPDLERHAIVKVLEETRGHQQRAASRLGISKRTLQRRIKSYGLVGRSMPVAG